MGNCKIVAQSTNGTETHKTNISQIPIGYWNAWAFLNEFLWTPWCSVGKQITITLSIVWKGHDKGARGTWSGEPSFLKGTWSGQERIAFAYFTKRSLRAVTWSLQGSPGTLIPDARPMCVSGFWLPTTSCNIYVSNWQPGLNIVIIIITINGTNTCERLLWLDRPQNYFFTIIILYVIWFITK